MKNMRHVVDVMAPPDPQGENARDTPPTTLMRNVPCSIETMTGREAERMAQMYADADLKVCMYGNPNKPLKTVHWLKFGERRFNIKGIIDKRQNGIELELICGEEVA